ncbi:MAG TPA: AAA family ATPase [Blastocatellia bacterium]|nr:AAA family ATPase [Blastocatellia bacterium]
MYTEFYGLKEIPFGLTPNPKFIYKTDSHLEVVSNLKYCISQSKGLAVVTGEVGTGKTTTLRSVLQQFGPDILSVYLFNPFVTVAEFFQLLSGGLNLGLGSTASKADLLNAIGACLAQRHSRGLRTVLIIDEAHGLSPAVLEEVRLLANFETNSEKLLQIVLCGQPELREILNQPGLRQLKQRVSLRCSIRPLYLYEINNYIRFRLRIAGAGRVNIFDPSSIELIGLASAGIPRVINNICDNALLYGYAAGQATIFRDIIADVIEALDITPSDLSRPDLPVYGQVAGSIT